MPSAWNLSAGYVPAAGTEQSVRNGCLVSEAFSERKYLEVTGDWMT